MEINIATKDLQNEIKSKIDSSLDTTVSSRAAQTTVNEINSNVGSNSDSANKNGSVHAKLKEIRNYISNCGIKSVQRGDVDLDLDSEGQYHNISISPVDVSKAFVVITNVYKVSGGGSSARYHGGYVKLINSTTLRFVCDTVHGWSDTIHWQVIEFY